MPFPRRCVWLLCALHAGLAFAGCPVDPQATDTVLLTVQMPGASARRLGTAELAALPQTELVQRRTVTSTGGDAKTSVDQGVRYGGVLLRDLLDRTVPELADRRGLRLLVIEAVATDGYRAVFSWGELFNATAGDQVLVIATQGGSALTSAEGPLALRALGDHRPGPRHVRKLCGLVGRLS